MNTIILSISGISQILTTCLCNIFTVVCGILTIEYIITANINDKQDNVELGHDKYKIARIINICGWVWFIISWIIRLKIVGLGQ